MISIHRRLIISESAIFRGIYRSINRLYFQDIYGTKSMREVFRIGTKLGESKFSVYRLESVDNDCKLLRRPCENLAIKVFPMITRSKKSSKSYLPRQFYTEMNMMTYLNSQPNNKHISKFRGAWVGQKCGFIMLKMYQITLYDAIVNNAQSMSFVLKCFAVLVRTVANCHRLHVAHRDIKPSNIMLSSVNNPNSVVLCDWDSSAFFSHTTVVTDDNDIVHNRGDNNTHTNPIGTLRYAAPEILTGDKKYDPFKLDTWSLACVLIFMLTRKSFFEGRTEDEVLNSIYTYTNSNIKVEWCNIIQNYIGEDGVDFVNRCTVLDYNDRITVQDMVSHPFIQKH